MIFVRILNFPLSLIRKKKKNVPGIRFNQHFSYHKFIKNQNIKLNV